MGLRDRVRHAFAGLVPVLLAACASLAPVGGERVYEGRFSATTDSGTARDSTAGRFLLAVRPGGMTLDLSSPLGTTLARLESAADGARLIVPGHEESSRSDPAGIEALTQTMIGWRVPVSGLADWMAGRPAPGRPARLIAADPSNGMPAAGLPATDAGPEAFEQDDWTIRVRERFDDATPRLLELQRAADGRGAPAVRVRLILDAPGRRVQAGRDQAADAATARG